MAQGKSGVISGSAAPRVCLQNRAQCPAKESGLTQLGWVILTVRNDINGPLQPLSVVGKQHKRTRPSMRCKRKRDCLWSSSDAHVPTVGVFGRGQGSACAL
ncbi:hypothetical protein DPX16_13141 [Anabarilius grahami]|uniref:Uncharacterized protein n=1 Tax=Anabarilius grahami TaxID=495550 RepID=A0A3N0YMJ2_ANAGA|nr:hypothetical protein DPX16_13141 [Anabarilius grahami]